MKDPVRLLFVGLALGPALASPPVRAQNTWDFNEMVAEVESRLPVAEKQAEAVVKMLDSEKHRQKLQEDIDSIWGEGGTSIPLQETYLSRVLAQLEVPLEKTMVRVTVLSGVGYGPSMTMLAPNFLVNLARGWPPSGPMHRNPERILSDKGKAERLAALCSRILAYQRPMQLAARLKVDSTKLPKSALSRGGGQEGKDSRDIYGIFLPNHDLSSDAVYFEAFQSKAPYVDRIDPLFLKYIKTQAKFLGEIGYRATDDWFRLEQVTAAVDKKLSRLAEETDLNDLKDGQKAADKKKELNLDDLKLPK